MHTLNESVENKKSKNRQQSAVRYGDSRCKMRLFKYGLMMRMKVYGRDEANHDMCGILPTRLRKVPDSSGV